MADEKPKSTPAELVDKATEMIVSAVPVLDGSTHGWWRLAILVVVMGTIAGGLLFLWKFDTNRAIDSVIEYKGRSPEHDNIQAPSRGASPCKEIGDSLECL